MSGTVLKNPLVREYLRTLNAACATLPVAQARELRAQVSAHLEEALPPEASYAEVREELRKLGTARSLAAEAAGPVPLTAAARLRNLLSHVRWWTWAVIGAAAAVIAAVVTYVILVETAQPLAFAGASAWWYPQDAARSVETQAAGYMQLTVPIRPGQQQGYVVTVENDSDWTQVILGPAPNAFDGIGAGGGAAQIGVGDSPVVEEGGIDTGVPYLLPGVVPPHQTREVRVLWTSNLCLDPGGQLGTNLLALRVRVGLITRTETIPLSVAFAVSGTRQSSSARWCPGGL